MTSTRAQGLLRKLASGYGDDPPPEADEMPQARGALTDQIDNALGNRRSWSSWTWVMLVLAGAHLVAAGLDALGRAAFQGIPSTLLGSMSDNDGWILVHIAAAVSLVAGFKQSPQIRSWACNLSSAFMASWSTLLLIVGLSVERGVSLLGPVFGMVLAVFAQLCAQRFFAEAVIRDASSRARLYSDDGA